MTTKIPAELSSTPGIVDGSNATAITIDSSEKVGIGTTSPSSLLHLGGSTNKGVEITSSTANAGYLSVYQDQAIFSINRDGADGSFADTSKAAAVVKLTSADADSSISFQTTTSNNAEPNVRVTIDKSGNVDIADGNLSFASGHGIDFSATGDGSGSMTSELLDDYEEGTWTPTFAGVAAAAVYGARYTKIGQLVMVESYIAGDTQNNTNQFQIGGLPYTSQNVTAYGGGSIGYTSSQDYTDFGSPLIPANSSYIYFHRIDGSSSASVTNNILYNRNSGNQLFLFQAFYRTA